MRVIQGRRFDYVVKVAKNSAELRSVASLRSRVFREDYDRVIKMDDSLKGVQRDRVLSTVEWDRLERRTQGGLVCVGAWLGEKCEVELEERILEESDRSAQLVGGGPVIGALDVVFGADGAEDLPQDVRSSGQGLLAYVSNVGVLGPCRCTGVAGSLLNFAVEAAATRSASRVYTHAIDLHGRSSLYHKHGFRRVSEAAADLEGHSGAVLLCKELR